MTALTVPSPAPSVAARCQGRPFVAWAFGRHLYASVCLVGLCVVSAAADSNRLRSAADPRGHDGSLDRKATLALAGAHRTLTASGASDSGWRSSGARASTGSAQSGAHVGVANAGAAHVGVAKEKISDVNAHVAAAAEDTVDRTGSDSAFSAAADATVQRLLMDDDSLASESGPQVDFGDLVRKGAARLDLNAAVQAVAPPPDVVALLKGHRRANASMRGAANTGSSDKAIPAGDMAAVEKAVGTLNDMISKAQIRLDTKVVECKQFQRQSKVTLAQMTGDLNRLGQTVANLAKVMTSALGSISSLSTSAQQAKEEQDHEKITRAAQRAADEKQLQQRQKDLEVATFMLDLTKCPKAQSLVQGITSHNKGVASSVVASTAIDICKNGSSQGVELRFKDSRLESAMENMTQDGRGMLELALSRASMSGASAAMVLNAWGFNRATDDREDGDEPYMPPPLGSIDNANDLALLGQEPLAAPTSDTPADEKKQANKCSQAEPDCGALHDMFANLWGEMKDLVDESTTKLRQDDEHFKSLEEMANAQLQQISTQKGTVQASLAEATSDKASQTESQTTKQEEAAELQKLDEETMHECAATIKHILYTEICGIVKVRNEVLKTTANVPPEEIMDCQVTDWVASECSSMCDENMTGGNQTLQREVIVNKKGYGASCPTLNMSAKCNQVKCPIDCALTDWSSWGKCTKECGGGIQSRTRAVEVKPKNGGTACDALQETQPCNTGSCDRDCVLSEWTPFGACSKACNSGFLERRKKVVVPVRAKGTCPQKNNHNRYEKVLCNEMKCVGDEKCMAKMDLIIAVDGSGSITERGFEVVKNFTIKIIDRMQPTVYGREAQRVGIVQFGNGALDDNKIVSDAILVALPSDNLEEIKEKVRALKWLKGFTNLAQAVLKADDVLKQHALPNKLTTVMLITDGRPTFKIQSSQAVKKLRKTSRVMVVHLKTFRKKDATELLKSYATVPWQTNYVHIKGKKALKEAYAAGVNDVIAPLCPRAQSPTRTAQMDSLRGFTKEKEGVTCASENTVSVMAQTMQDSLINCGAAASQHEGWKGFAYSSFDSTCVVYSGAENCTEFSKNQTYDFYIPAAKLPGPALSPAEAAAMMR